MNVTILSMVQFRRHSTYLLKWSSLFPNQNVAILEIGFGIGLNAFITFLSLKLQQSIEYVGVEAIHSRRGSFNELRFRIKC
jgi:tRNA G46 methylase TrmB